MPEKKLRDMTDDEAYLRWQDRFRRIHHELSYLFSTRQKFKDIQEMFQTNQQLNEIGSQAYRWLLGIWGRDAVIAVRRELDSDRNTISFGALLDEMTQRPRVLNRRRYMSFMHNAASFVVQRNHEVFSEWGVVSPSADRGDDYLDPTVIGADREHLDVAAAPVLEYANRLIAHRTPIDELQLTVKQINDAIDAIEPVFKKYHVLLTGRALMRIEPYNQGDDWRDAFKFAWYPVRREDLQDESP